MSNIPTITTDIFVAYSQCPRKAFLLLFSEDRGKPHDYLLILRKRRQNNRAQYLDKFLQEHPEAKEYGPTTFKKHTFLLEATLNSEPLEAYCAVLTQADTDVKSHRITYEPTIITGTYRTTADQKTELLFTGSVLGKIQKQEPTVGRIVGMDGKVHRIKLETSYKSIKPSLKILKNWCSNPPTDPPTLILNKHCPACQFQKNCRKQAGKDSNLSLLARMTAKEIKKYNKRGIFTVQQLSYLFKPRRKRKKRKNPEPVKHNMALQALAIREGKIYIQELPKLNRQPVELFLDIEGIPDQSFYY
ncbi:MAG: TM0106 family RecB-like putative nuclease, partial [Cyanobacteria bacterium P01_F01_bin.53]